MPISISSVHFADPFAFLSLSLPLSCFPSTIRMILCHFFSLFFTGGTPSETQTYYVHREYKYERRLAPLVETAPIASISMHPRGLLSPSKTDDSLTTVYFFLSLHPFFSRTALANLLFLPCVNSSRILNVSFQCVNLTTFVLYVTFLCG